MITKAAETKRQLPYIEVIFELTHPTPCQLAPHGSPPFGTHPGRGGEPSAPNKLFIA